MQPITFYFDYISPYAYLGWKRVHAVAARHGRAVHPVPVLFARLLDANGQKGPAEIPRKRIYVFKDVYRTAHRMGVSLAPPPSHPFNPLLALRVSSLPMPEETRRALVDGLFAAAWGGGAGVTDPGEVAVLARSAGLDGERALEEAATQEAKDRVRQQTEAALDAGAFGVPTMIVDGELFWGVDSLDNLELVLRGADPVRSLDLARWANLPASAIRKHS